jgi:hypothetical protein
MLMMADHSGSAITTNVNPGMLFWADPKGQICTACGQAIVGSSYIAQ